MRTVSYQSIHSFSDPPAGSLHLMKTFWSVMSKLNQMACLLPTRHELFRVSEYELCFISRYSVAHVSTLAQGVLKAVIGCVGESNRDRDCVKVLIVLLLSTRAYSVTLK